MKRQNLTWKRRFIIPWLWTGINPKMPKERMKTQKKEVQMTG
tara:strand:- start:10 stop:135 length:126 start_codon:yes stop_codon:yes gene_type:complete